MDHPRDLTLLKRREVNNNGLEMGRLERDTVVSRLVRHWKSICKVQTLKGRLSRRTSLRGTTGNLRVVSNTVLLDLVAKSREVFVALNYSIVWYLYT